MNHFQPPAGREPDDASTNDFTGDPLERLIEAFVEQSVPEGPDAATKRHMLATMLVASAAGQGGSNLNGRPQLAIVDEPRRVVKLPRPHRWAAVTHRKLVALAAAILMLATAAYLKFHEPIVPTDPDHGVPIVMTPDVPQHEMGTARDDSQDVFVAFQKFLADHDRQAADPRALPGLFAQFLRENPKLADSPSWRLAQERITYALERPEVIGVGVGLLGTIPWTTYARF